MGIRSPEALYFPDYATVPTGLVVKEDTEGTLREAFLREVNEDTDNQLDHEMHLVAITTEDRDPFPNLDDAANTMATCIAADLSAAEGRPVALDEV